jgi:hypothetical protein
MDLKKVKNGDMKRERSMNYEKNKEYLKPSNRSIQGVKKTNSVFALLAEDSEDESKLKSSKSSSTKSNKKVKSIEMTKSVEPETFPALSDIQVKPLPADDTLNTISYASMASKPYVPKSKVISTANTVTVPTICDFIINQRGIQFEELKLNTTHKNTFVQLVKTTSNDSLKGILPIPKLERQTVQSFTKSRTMRSWADDYSSSDDEYDETYDDTNDW